MVEEGGDGPEDFEIIQTIGVGAWVVGEEEPEEDQD